MVSYPVIRNFYFPDEQKEVGIMLLSETVNALLDNSDRVYAFFHYFGMFCYARHGKLFEGFGMIHDLLMQNGFAIEHENVYYSSTLDSEKNTDINLKWKCEPAVKGRCRGQSDAGM